MASIGIITASIQRACTKKLSTQATTGRALRTTHTAANVVVPKLSEKTDNSHHSPLLTSHNPKELEHGIHHPENQDEQLSNSDRRFSDERWKNGTWDLNMFVKNGRMDWDSVIVAEAKRRKILQVYPESSVNEEPVLFRSSIIPWWAWIVRSHLPEAERLNGRAAMVGFFMAYFVDGLTGLDLVGQTGNFVCKAALLVTIVGVLVFRRKEDVENIRKLVDEATFYDKQWQSSWQDPDALKQEIIISKKK
ncbi:hypothetical protein ABFX02_06G054000 [Erythranthe guttata]